jgi:hypothetical protein
MFSSDMNQDNQSKKITRRVFLASGITAATGLAVLSLRHASVVEASAKEVHGTPGEVTIECQEPR